MPRKKKSDPKPKKSGAKFPSRTGVVPSEAEILNYLRLSAADGRKVGKREIARAFGLKGAARIELKERLRDMTARGLIDRRSKEFLVAGELPKVAVLDVVGPDDEGELIAKPSVWDEETQGPRPSILLLDHGAPSRRAKGADRLPRPGDRVLARIRPAADEDLPYPYVAQVIRRIDHAADEILGVFRRNPSGGGYLEPVEKRGKKQPILVKPGDGGDAVNGELVRAEVRKDRRRGLMWARVIERLGDVDDQRNISLIAIHEQGIRDRFPEEVLREVEELGAFDEKGREDIRHIPLVTIDPPDARDHDDAVWAAPDDDPENEGGFRVIVAIADVAAYVRPGTALDAEARLRGNSTYFPDRVVPMLPERISNDLCSLRAGEDRPALACFMTFDRHGNKRKHRFARVIMRSAAFLSYEEAQAAIDGFPDEKTEPLLEPVLKPLWAAHRALMEARARRQPLELDVPERKLILDAAGLIERVVTPVRLEAHKLIEEMMIQANVCAAETLEARNTPLIYRVHDAPSPEKIAALAQFLKTLGISAPLGQRPKPMHFNRILQQVKGTEFEHVVNEVVLRTQSQAIYDTENIGHFGLNLARYAHFTSPIRRYADLIVHRGLIKALKLGRDGLSKEDIEKMDETAELISGCERRSMAAERDTVARMMAAHMAERIGATFPARISGVTRAGLFVALVENGADGFVPIASLGDDYYVHDEKRFALIGRRTGKVYQLGDPVEVRLLEATPMAGGLRFELVSGGKARASNIVAKHARAKGGAALTPAAKKPRKRKAKPARGKARSRGKAPAGARGKRGRGR